jgi:uncharacterized protein YbjT (DUF2867 family)
MQPANQPARVWPLKTMKASALPGPQHAPELVEQEPESSGDAIVKNIYTRRGTVLSGLVTAASGLGAAASPAMADTSETTTIAVAGAAGSLGKRVLKQLSAQSRLNIIGLVRNIDKATEKLSKTVPLSNTLGGGTVKLAKLDVVKEAIDDLAQTLKGVKTLFISIGFVPSDPFVKNAGWADAAKAVDNIGTTKLIDAAKVAGVSKVVLVSAILTDAGAWGQRKSTVYQATNFFGGVLDQKLVAEKHLRSSGLDYTILRPGGYTDGGFKPAMAGNLVFAGENTFNMGEISRDEFANVCVDALFNPGFNNKVVEVVQRNEKQNLFSA